MSSAETKTAEADAYTDRVLTDMPEYLSDAHIIRIIGTLITSYVPNTIDAARLMVVALDLAGKYHDEMSAAAVDDECMCADCVAHRKASSH